MYWLWSLILFGVWLAVFAANAAGREKMLRMILITLPLGLTVPLFVPAYWTRPTQFDLARRTGFDLESLLFAFAAGGLAATLYDAMSGARWQALPPESRSGGRHRWHAFALATLALVYSFFSHVLWPMFVPLAVGLLETVPWRRKALAACQIAGVAVGLYLLYAILEYPVTARVLGQHIIYESPHFYIVAVVSMWCFFAAVLSFIVYYHFRLERSMAPGEESATTVAP
jgi:hypothetical protein